VKIGLLERFLRSGGYGTVLGMIYYWILFFILLISTGNVYVALPGSIVIITAILGVLTIRVHRHTGRWWFVPLPRHLPLDEPSYDVRLAGFWEAVEFQPDEKE
jgi:hypothetical protein